MSRRVVNTRNIEKLIEALRACRGHVQVSGSANDRIEGSLDQVAHDLAARGVLVPSALTMDQLGTLAMRSPPPIDADQDDRKLLLRNLERAAKGEAF